MKVLPKVELVKKFHRNEHQILIKFRYNDSLINIIRALNGFKWSNTLRCWYVKNTDENLKLLLKSIKNKVKLVNNSFFDNSMPLYKYPERRIRKLTSENKETLNGFYKYLKGKRYSESTVKTYTFLIADFIEFNNATALKDFTKKELTNFIETIYIKRKYSISIQRQFISALKQFLLYFPHTEIDELKLERPKKSVILPKVLSQFEILELIKRTQNLKHRTVIAMLYSCGLRISELLNLKINELDIDRRQVLVRNSKGRKDRYVSLAENMLPLLNNYLLSYRPSYYLIEGVNDGKYSAESVRKFLKVKAKLAGINKIVTPHILRHSYATHMLENGVDLRYIQSLLGHSRPETTMIYTHVQRKDLMSITNPLDRALELLSKPDNQTKKVLLS